MKKAIQLFGILLVLAALGFFLYTVFTQGIDFNKRDADPWVALGGAVLGSTLIIVPAVMAARKSRKSRKELDSPYFEVNMAEEDPDLAALARPQDDNFFPGHPLIE